MAKVFVSYATENSALADEVYGWLRSEGHLVFLARHPQDGIGVGDDWEQRLYERLRWSDAVLCLVTAAYTRSVWCSAELGIARSLGCWLLPVRVEAGVVHPLLRSVQVLDYGVAWRDRIAVVLRRLDAGGATGWTEGRNPYPGLRPFGADLHRVFFGRSQEAEDLASVLRSPAEGSGGMTLVVGPSGCGKSSLLRAGLVPLLGAEQGWWTLPVCVPGTDPLQALARVVTAAALRIGLDWTVASVRERFDGERGLAALAEELLVAAPGGPHQSLLVAVDQVEEVLTQAGESARAQFARVLMSGGEQLRIVGSMRPEFLALLLADPALDALSARTFPLRPLRREALVSVIQGPARLAGIGIDDELTARLVADTGDGEALPLLAFTLFRLADGARRGTQLSLAQYQQLGGVRGAVSQQAATALDNAREATGRDEDCVLAGLLRLVAVDEEGRPTRWRVPRAELPDQVNAELDEFVKLRLLVTDIENDDTVVIAVAHEAFLSEWQPLAQVVEAQRDTLRRRRAVEQAAAEWAAENEDAALLYRGNRLTQVRELLSGDELTAVARRFVEASAAAELREQWVIRRRRQRRRIALLVTGILVVTSASAGVYSLQQNAEARVQATIALANSLAGQSQGHLQARPDVAQLLAAASISNASTSESWSAATAALSVPFRANHRVADNMQLTDTSPNHASFVLQNTDRAELWDLATERRLLTLPPGQRTVGFSRDGNRLLTRDDLGYYMWDAQTGVSAGRIQLSADDDDATAASPDLGTVAVVTADGRLRLVDSASGSIEELVGGHLTTVDIARFSNSANFVASASIADRSVLLWDLQDRSLRATFRLPDSVALEEFSSIEELVFNVDDSTLAVRLGSGNAAVMWNLATGTDTVLSGHPERVSSVTFSPDGKVLATSSGFGVEGLSIASAPGVGVVKVWDATTGLLIHEFSGQTGIDDAPVFSGDGSLLATSDVADNDVVNVWDRNSGRHVARLTEHTRRVNRAEFVDDGTALITASNDGTLRMWDVRSGVATVTFASDDGLISDFIISQDGRKLVSYGQNTVGSETYYSVRVWELQEADQHTPKTLTGHSWRINRVLSSQDGSTLVTASSDLTVRRWSVESGEQLGEVTGFTAGVDAIAVSPDGSILAWPTDNNAIRLWSVADHRRIGLLAGHTDWVLALAFSPDGTLLASAGSDGTVRLWDIKNQTSVATLPSQGSIIDAVAFTPDGAMLATANRDHTVRLWDVEERSNLGYLGGHIDQVKAVAFSPNGETLASAGKDGAVMIWNVSNMSRIKILAHHTDSVYSIAFSADGSLLASASDDGGVRLWKTEDYSVTAPLVGHTDFVRSVVFVGNTNIVASASWDGSVRLWLAPQSWVPSLCQRAGRNFTLDEWQRYFGSERPYERVCSAWPSGRGAPADAPILTSVS